MLTTDFQEPGPTGTRFELPRSLAGACRAEFGFEPQGRATIVTSSLGGVSDFAGRIGSLFMNTGKMIGTQPENGLSQFNAISENFPRTQHVT
jgi:hypothetical protein